MIVFGIILAVIGGIMLALTVDGMVNYDHEVEVVTNSMYTIGLIAFAVYITGNYVLIPVAILAAILFSFFIIP